MHRKPNHPPRLAQCRRAKQEAPLTPLNQSNPADTVSLVDRASEPFSETYKAAIAEAVHLAVCATAHPNLVWRICPIYALAGALLLRDLTGREDFYPQLGSVWLQTDPTDPTLWLAVLADATDIGGYRAGEMHAWVGDAQTEDLIDFSARHWPQLVVNLTNIGTEQPRWNRGQPPPYVWGPYQAWPDYVRLKTSEAATHAVVTSFAQGADYAWVQQIRSHAKILLQGTVLITQTGEWALPGVRRVRPDLSDNDDGEPR